MQTELDEHEHVDLGELEGSLGFLLRMAQVKTFRAYFSKLSRLDLKPGEFSVLWVVGLNPGLKQGTVAQRLSIKPAHMTKLVQRLVSLGFIERATPENDRRSVHLMLTKSGRSFLDTNRSEFQKVWDVERASLTQTEADDLAHLLRKIIDF